MTMTKSLEDDLGPCRVAGPNCDHVWKVIVDGNPDKSIQNTQHDGEGFPCPNCKKYYTTREKIDFHICKCGTRFKVIHHSLSY